MAASFWLCLLAAISICCTPDGVFCSSSRTWRNRHRRAEWSCPQVTTRPTSSVSCQCDLPHTLRCSGLARSADDVESIVGALRTLPTQQSVSLLDLSIQNLSRVSPLLFESVTLHGLVISSGEVSEVSDQAFVGLGAWLTALGLPNNRLTSVPAAALRTLVHLERLDLSNNRIQSIPSQLLSGLDSLRFLDLSGNLIETIGAQAFPTASNLRILHLRSNLLDAAQLGPSSLAGLKKLQEIDLSFNKLRGRLTASFLQGLDNLITLELTANNFTLLKRGMLSGLKRLRHLRLAYNQIDVIEDQSFVSLSGLSTLDLSHNGVVAISGQSLSHLNNLAELDLSHNYLRALTVDLVGGLSSLESLDLTDNDISSVEPEALENLPKLGHLSLTDNPLNCDCQLVALARWLRNSTRLTEENRQSAVCATPPHLENGLLITTSMELLTCTSSDDESLPPEISAAAASAGDGAAGVVSGDNNGDNFLSSQPTEDFIRLSSAQVQFRSAELESSSLLHTVWHVDAATLPYTCDAILVYELSEDQEILLESYPVRCHSDDTTSTAQLPLSVKLSDKMKADRQYRLCLVLFEGGHDDEASLLPGCSHSMSLESLKSSAYLDADQDERQITAFYANVTGPSAVSVFMRIQAEAAAFLQTPPGAQCYLTVVVFEKQRLLAQKRLNCSATSFTFGHLTQPVDALGEYEVCATFDTEGLFLPPPEGEREADGDIVLGGRQAEGNRTGVQYAHCVVAKVPARVWAVENTLVVIAVTVVFVLVAAALLVGSYLLARRLFFRRNKLWSSSDTLSVPKATSRHILYVPEVDYFTDSSCSSPDSREETSTNV